MNVFRSYAAKNQFPVNKRTRRGRPRWKQTIARLAPPLCPIFLRIFFSFFNFNFYFIKKINFFWHVTGDMWHVTCDTWQVTGDRWHLTPDNWHMTHSVGWTFSQNFSSLALPVWDWVYISRPGKDSIKILSRIYRVDGHPRVMKIWTFCPRPAQCPWPTSQSVYKMGCDWEAW